MKKLKFVALLAALISAGGGKSYAHNIAVANADGVTIYYNFTNNQTELAVTYQGSSAFKADYTGKVVIPESVTYGDKTYSVTSIGKQAFYYCSDLTEIGIPNSVTEIGDNAFYGCKGLTEVTIPNSVTEIGEQAFYDCTGLEKITVESGNPKYDSKENCNAIIETAKNEIFLGCKNTQIPNSVTSIGKQAFFHCSGLTKLTIPNSVTSIGEQAFVACTGLTELTIGNSVTSIGQQAFVACTGLTEVTIPNSVTSIGTNAFSSCSLTEVTIPNSVMSIEANPFSSCDGLEKIVVESGNPNYDSRENCNAIIRTGTNGLIAGCKNTQIPNSVTSIGENAFAGYSGLTEVTIPGSVISIGLRAFSGCSGLTEVTIPNSVTSIGNMAFQSCSGLTELTIGNSVKSIDDNAFYNCYGLTTLYSLNTTPPSAKTSTFVSNHYKNVAVFVPQEALEAYLAAGVWKNFTNLQAIDGSAAVTEINANAEQIQTANGQVTVTGLTDGTTVAVYDLSGQQVGTATSKGGQVSISTGMTAGAAAIVKVGERSVKTVMK